MERIFPSLYRFSGTSKKGETNHSYLLVRKAANLLVCHQGGPFTEDFDEIEDLGGIGSQWVCHQHDVKGDKYHEDLYARFDCSLHYHRRDQKVVRMRTKCPEVQFGDDGIKLAPDFEALYYPSCTDGHSIFRWRHRGKVFLFTSHAFYMRGNKWNVSCLCPNTARNFCDHNSSQSRI